MVGVAWRLALIALLVAATVGTSACQPTGGGNGDGSGEATASTEATGTNESSGLPGGEGGIARAAEAVLPSVVYVSNQQSVQDPDTGQRSQLPMGSGSGVVIRADGHILTNNHVIAGSDSVTVRVGDEDIDATIVGRDPATDLAVVKIERDGLVAAQVGDIDGLTVGEWVVAVGFPFGLDRTVTAGIVSGLGRSTVQASQNEVTAYTDLIQTDAAINPGNSGGALADLEGRVVGINTLIESSTGQSAGVGFAIPMDFAMDVAKQLIDTGKAEHTFMGVSISSANPHGADGDTAGALVEAVEAGSPAAKAGIKQGDVIVGVGDEEIRTSDDVFTAVRSRRPGDTVEVRLKRGEETVTVDVTLVGRASLPGE